MSKDVHIIAMIQGRTQSNPIYSKDIERRLAISGVAVREAVHNARTEQNVPICSGPTGYFMPRNMLEAQSTIRSLYSRAKQNREAAEGMEKHYNKEKQMRLI